MTLRADKHTHRFCRWCGIGSGLRPTTFAGRTLELCPKCVQRLAAAERGEPSHQIMPKALVRAGKEVK